MQPADGCRSKTLLFGRSRLSAGVRVMGGAGAMLQRQLVFLDAGCTGRQPERQEREAETGEQRGEADKHNQTDGDQRSSDEDEGTHERQSGKGNRLGCEA